MRNEDGLTPQQQRFVEEYVVDLNATQAAIRAGYSEKTAEQIGYQQLQHPSVRAAVDLLIRARSARTQVTADKVLQELACVAFSNMAHYAVWDGTGVTLTMSERLPETAQRAVAEVKQTENKQGKSITFRLHDKTTALVKLGEHLGLFGKDRVQAVDPEEIKQLSDEELEKQCRQFKLIA